MDETLCTYNICIVCVILLLYKFVYFLDEIRKILAFLSAGDYENIVSGTFARCILCLDKNYEEGEF